jgi:predicted small lipoprotein YifL
MKNKFKLLVALSFLFAVTSCNNDKSVDAGHNHEQHEQDAHAGHDHGDVDDELVLNDGKKWEMNPEMLTIVRSMEKDVTTFTSEKLAEMQALGGKLDGQVNELTSSCTMDGQAHDELHKWLLPFIHDIKHLKESVTDDEAKESIRDLKASFAEFNQYFE